MRPPRYILDVHREVPVVPALVPGRYVVETEIAGWFLNRFPDHVGLAFDPLDVSLIAPPDDEDVLIVRPGGFGDLLFLTPLIHTLKLRGCRVTVACAPQFAPILAHNPDLHAVAPYPVPLELWREFDAHIWLERILEDGTYGTDETHGTHAVDLIARAARVPLVNRRMRYFVTEEERHEAVTMFPDAGLRRVGIQVEASAMNRSYPFEMLQEVGSRLVNEGCEVFLFGVPGRLKADAAFVNLTEYKLTFRQSCAVLATCDAMVTPDSSLCHVAGALDVPTVALFGPFPWQVRTAHAPSIRAIQGQAPCAPCFHHEGDGTMPWPEGCPGRESGRCEALAQIEPRRIVAKVMDCLTAKGAKDAKG